MRSSSLANEELMRSMRSSRLQWGCARAPSWTAAAPQPLTPRVHAMLVGVRPRVRQGKGGSRRGDLDRITTGGARRGDLDLRERDGQREGKRHLRRRLGGLTDAPTARRRGTRPRCVIVAAWKEESGGVEDSSGGRYTCRQAGPGVGELLEGLRWGSCGEERIASASHVLTCHVVSSTSRPERRASHHATHSGPART